MVGMSRLFHTNEEKQILRDHGFTRWIDKNVSSFTKRFTPVYCIYLIKKSKTTWQGEIRKRHPADLGLGNTIYSIGWQGDVEGLVTLLKSRLRKEPGYIT